MSTCWVCERISESLDCRGCVLSECFEKDDPDLFNLAKYFGGIYQFSTELSKIRRSERSGWIKRKKELFVASALLDLNEATHTGATQAGAAQAGAAQAGAAQAGAAQSASAHAAASQALKNMKEKTRAGNAGGGFLSGWFCLALGYFRMMAIFLSRPFRAELNATHTGASLAGASLAGAAQAGAAQSAAAQSATAQSATAQSASAHAASAQAAASQALKNMKEKTTGVDAVEENAVEENAVEENAAGVDAAENAFDQNAQLNAGVDAGDENAGGVVGPHLPGVEGRARSVRRPLQNLTVLSREHLYTLLGGGDLFSDSSESDSFDSRVVDPDYEPEVEFVSPVRPARRSGRLAGLRG